jgi:putative ABC transport system substrate-binding protein
MLERAPAQANFERVNAFRQGLRELGYIEGKNLVIEYRSTGGRDDLYPKLCAEAVRLKVDLILVRGTPPVVACKQATATIPILIGGAGDPVADGLVASLAHPGGNVTGLSTLTVGTAGKRLQLLREVLPKASRVGVLVNMSNPNVRTQWKQLLPGAEELGIRLTPLDVRKPEDLEPAFAKAAKQRLDSVYVTLDALTDTNRKLIGELALKQRLPTVTPEDIYVDAGCLISYGQNGPALYRRAASIADKILRGTKPADIPVEQPTELQLVVNLRTAKALGVIILKVVLFRADRVIE